jgi:pyridoxine kinase
MKRNVKRVAAIHDLSGFGRSSLAVIIPTLSTMGIQVCSLPTAVLSAHTDFEGYSFVDLTDTMESFIQHWVKLGLDLYLQWLFRVSPAN